MVKNITCILFIFIILGIINNSYQSNECSFSINGDLTDPQPLIIKPNQETNSNAFYQPSDSSGLVNINAGDLINFECPGGNVLLAGVSATKNNIQGKCKASNKFEMSNGVTTLFSEITCSKPSAMTARFTGKACLVKYKGIEIGYTLSDARFIKHMTICWDSKTQNTLYSVYELTPAIAGYQVSYPRPAFIEGAFYSLGSKKLDNLYARNVQRETINSLLGLAADSYKYIQRTNDYYLARGHLTAKTDFVYGSQQRLTFYFVNSGPQWQTVNAGNWLSMEDNLRNMASARNLDLTVYTGTHGILKLPHEVTGVATELYLYVDAANQIKAIPVPEVYWKVVYDPITKAGVALIGVNNPYIDTYVPICKNICKQVTWLTWKPDAQKSGYAYCCKVNDFRKIVKELPAFSVKSVLV